MTTGQRIKEARKKAGLSQKELAEKLGISYVGISQWENDKRKPKQDSLQRIAEAVGTTVFDLMGVQFEDAPSIVDAGEINSLTVLPTNEACILKIILKVIEDTYGHVTEKNVEKDFGYVRAVEDYLYIVENRTPQAHEPNTFILTSYDMSDLIRASIETLSATLPILIERLKDVRPINEVVSDMMGISDIVDTSISKE